MSHLKVFNHPAFGSLEILTKDAKELFPAIEVANKLGYANPREAVIKHCKTEGVAFHDVLSNGGIQQKKFINEGNLYRLIVRSKLPDAEKFETWVFEEILPSIRKHGAYMTPETLESVLLNPDTLINLATKLKEEQEAKRKAIEERERAERLLLEQHPKVVFAEAIETSSNSILVKNLSVMLKQKGVDIGQNRLFEWLRDHDFLCKKKGDMYNLPTQRSMDMGLFELKSGVRTGSDGEFKTTYTPKVTGKGQVYFINKFLNQQGVI